MEFEEIILRLRGRTEYFRVEGETLLLNPQKYPFGRGELPVLCDMEGEPSSAYISGNRSIILPEGGLWFKAKAIGIPFGISRPFYRDGKLFSYFLSEANIGSGRLIWGFSTVKEAENELRWMRRAKEMELPSTEPIGMGIYENVFVIELKNRKELFSYLNRTSRELLMERFSRESRKVEAACLFCLEPTDVRVDEVLYAFSFPGVDELLGREDCKDYLRWLGSSCGYNLRLHHDCGIMHGTIQADQGFMTNSHVANHLVGEEGTWMTDYHMAGELREKDLRKLEVFFLCHVMNPLPNAEAIARSHFSSENFPRFEFYELLLSSSPDALASLGAFPLETPKSELTEAFIEGVELGYYKRSVFEVESRLKREMLRKSLLLKGKIWEILGIPKKMQRGVEYFRLMLQSKKTEDCYKKLRDFLEGV
ncbi:MAG: hypothetical protein DRO05_03460 [Thermoproteota archaeon]|nr:MAG: hypothetical protein DRO05_03460 [Candidatus Korarchaeota archaeon]